MGRGATSPTSATTPTLAVRQPVRQQHTGEVSAAAVDGGNSGRRQDNAMLVGVVRPCSHEASSWDEDGPCVGCVAAAGKRKLPTQTIITSYFVEGEEEDWERSPAVMGRQFSRGRGPAQADPTRPAGPAMEVPMPFATQSKRVSRSSPEAAAPGPNSSTRDLWDRLSQQPSSHWMEEYHEAPPLLTSGCVVRRGAVETEAGPFPWLVIPTLEKLPSPKELCHRKKKGAKQKRLEDARALSVLYHLEELKRRQRNIDKLKSAQWSVGVPQPCCDGAGGAPGPLAKAACQQDPLSPFGMPAAPQLYNGPPVPHRCHDVQLLYPEWNPAVKEQLAFPEDTSTVSYTGAAWERHPMASARCLPAEEFWGISLPSEE